MSPLEVSDLESTGWERRFEVDAARASELVKLYSDVGYEVTTRRIKPEEIGPECAGCAIAACQRHVVVYTRRQEEVRREQ